MQRFRIAVILISSGLVLSYPGLWDMALALYEAANTTAGLCMGGVVVALAMTLGTTIVFLVSNLRGMLNDQNRPVDGSFPLQRVKNRDGSTTIVVPDNIYDVGVKVLPNGEIVPLAQNVPDPLFASFRAAVEAKHRVQAAIPGDKVYTGGGLFNRFLGGGKRNADAVAAPRVTAPLARLVAGSYDKPQRVVDSTAYAVEKPEEVRAPAPVQPVTAIEAFRGNTNTQFALGQTGDGNVVYWDCTEAPHIRFHGKSQGSGKTNAIKQVVLGAVRSGAHAMLLDRRSFKDWSDYRQHVEMVDTRDPIRFVDAIWQLCQMYQDRDKLLGASGVGTIAQLQQAPPRIFAVISEFGALCEVAHAEKMLDDVLEPLRLILREAGATGVHMIFEDQVVERTWPRTARANSTPITGFLPQNSASAGDYYYAHKLRPFEFHYDGQTFKTWDMKIVAPQMLAKVPPMPRGGVLKPSTTTNKPQPVTERRTPNAEPVFDPRKADNREIIFHWRKENPDGAQSEFRQWCDAEDIAMGRGYISDTFALYDLWQWRDARPAGSQGEYNDWRAEEGKSEVPGVKLAELWATYDRLRKPKVPVRIFRDGDGLQIQ